MTDQPDRAGSADAPIDSLSFDDALAALQKTVAELEAGGQPLERSIALYERGVALHEAAPSSSPRQSSRSSARHRRRSFLVALLVLLPVAAMVAGIAIYRTTTPTADAEDAAQFGSADLMAFNTTLEALEPLLPAGSVIEQTTYTDGRIVLPGSKPGVSIRALRIDGLAEGISPSRTVTHRGATTRWPSPGRLPSWRA